MPQELKALFGDAEIMRKQQMLREAIDTRQIDIMVGIRIYIWRLKAANNRAEVEEAAKEILQDTIAKALQIAEKYDPHFPLDKWLLGIAINEIRQFKRIKRLQARFLIPVSDTPLAKAANRSGAATMMEDEIYDLLYHSETQPYTLQEIFSVVSENEREVLSLHFIDGLSGEELAAALGITLGAAYTRLSRAKNNLRQQFINR